MIEKKLMPLSWNKI